MKCETQTFTRDTPIEVVLRERDRWERMAARWYDWAQIHGENERMPREVQEAKEYVLSVFDREPSNGTYGRTRCVTRCATLNVREG